MRDDINKKKPLYGILNKEFRVNNLCDVDIVDSYLIIEVKFRLSRFELGWVTVCKKYECYVALWFLEYILK